MVTRVQTWWKELHRERTPERRGRRSRSGVAMLLVITIVTLLTVVVTEVVHGAAMRIQLAGNQRDEAKAEALAMSGVQFYRLLLIASQQLGSGFYNMLRTMLPKGMEAPITSDTLWQMVPDLNSNMMRLLLLTDNDVDDAKALAAEQAAGKDKEATEVPSRLKKHFLDFDGDFAAHVEDEDRRIFVGRINGANMVQLQSDPHAGMLAALMTGDNQDAFLRKINFEKWQLIGSLVDWTDVDDQRVWDGGSERSAYDNMAMDGEDPYPPKNAAFDTQEEIRLVEGWNNDEVWMRFGRHLTIYGGGKVNVNTADHRVMEAIFQRFIQPAPTQDGMNLIWQQIEAFRNTSVFLEGGGGIFHDVSNFVALLKEIAPGTVDDGIANALTTSSTTFRVTSGGEVGDSKVAITAVFDFQKSPIGKVLYWQVQ